jgi:MYXO-CTERM domain-containing protein
MAGSLRRAAAAVFVIAMLARSAAATVTPDWVPDGSIVDGVVFGDDSISMPIYSGVGGLPIGQPVTPSASGLQPLGSSHGVTVAPEPSSGLLAALAAFSFLWWRRKVPSIG